MRLSFPRSISPQLESVPPVWTIRKELARTSALATGLEAALAAALCTEQEGGHQHMDIMGIPKRCFRPSYGLGGGQFRTVVTALTHLTALAMLAVCYFSGQEKGSWHEVVGAMRKVVKDGWD